jgi:hypothetical protein
MFGISTMDWSTFPPKPYVQTKRRNSKLFKVVASVVGKWLVQLQRMRRANTLAVESAKTSKLSQSSSSKYIQEREKAIFLSEKPYPDSSVFLVDGDNLWQLLDKYVLNGCCSKCGNKTLFLSNWTRLQSCSPTFSFKCGFNGCKFQDTFRCSKGLNGSHRIAELPVKLIISFLTAGLTYTNYQEVLGLMDMEGMSETQFLKYVDMLELETKEMVKELLLQHTTEALEEGSVAIVSDGGWSSRGWNALECTVFVFNAKTGKLLDFENVIKELPGCKHGNYVGNSTTMEGEGLRRIIARLHSLEIDISYLVHDGDNTSLAICQQHYPDIKELSDTGHLKNNFRKKIVALKSLYPELKGFGSKCVTAFASSLKRCDGDVTKFTKLMKGWFYHFCGHSHESCTHGADFIPFKWHYIEEPKAQ